MEYKYIKTDKEFSNYLEELRLQNITEIALDIEGEYNLHSYGEKLCLIQVFDGNVPVIIDAFEVSINLIRELFETRIISKIMFDSSSDQRLLYKQYNIRIHNIIDLKPAVDILDYEGKNLGALLTDKLKLDPIDKKSFQMYDWQTRPIDAAAINYAIMDVLYLFELRRIMFIDLKNEDKYDAYKERNFGIQSQAPKISKEPPIFRKRFFINLSPSQQRKFTKIYWIRDKYAKQLDFPPFHVFSNEKIRKLTVKPHTVETLQTREEIDESILRKLKNEILRVSRR